MELDKGQGVYVNMNILVRESFQEQIENLDGKYFNEFFKIYFCFKSLKVKEIKKSHKRKFCNYLLDITHEINFFIKQKAHYGRIGLIVEDFILQLSMFFKEEGGITTFETRQVMLKYFGHSYDKDWMPGGPRKTYGNANEKIRDMLGRYGITGRTPDLTPPENDLTWKMEKPDIEPPKDNEDTDNDNTSDGDSDADPGNDK